MKVAQGEGPGESHASVAPARLSRVFKPPYHFAPYVRARKLTLSLSLLFSLSALTLLLRILNLLINSQLASAVRQLINSRQMETRPEAIPNLSTSRRPCYRFLLH